MIAWLRRRWWQIEDTIVDLIDWQRPAPSIKPLQPPAPELPQHYGSCICTSVSFERATNEQINDQFWNEIFQRLAARQLFELRY